MSKIQWGTVYFIRPVANFDKDLTNTAEPEVLVNSCLLSPLRIIDNFVVGIPKGDKGFDAHDSANKERFIPLANVAGIDYCEDEETVCEYQ